MNKKVKTFSEILKITKQLQKSGKKIVFVHGFFDILHSGHATLFAEAKKLGDILVVGVEHDDNAKILKGPARPINSHNSRMYVISQVEPVDFVFLIPSIKGRKINVLKDFYVGEIYKTLKPDVIASCLKAGKFEHMKRKDAEEIGAKFVDIGMKHDISTTKIIKVLGLD
jgi:rfaE bifunctional protein nucleotidyltransferase chain/domain